jgi:hypothetical protein
MFKAAITPFCLFFSLIPAPPAAGGAPVPDCEAHAAAAGREAGIPDGILPAIARVESGRRGKAWPWTLNQAGNGSFHATKAEALAALTEIRARGVQNVDLGCMQINWRWHAQEFSDAASMLDPATNTRYAARYLRQLHDRLGDWDSAVAAYHSANPTRGAAYGRKVATARDRILAEGSDAAPALDLAGAPPATAPEAPEQSLTHGLLALSGRPVIGMGRADDPRQTGRAGGIFTSAARPLLSAGN